MALVLECHAAHAQSVTPMRGAVTSFADEFALRITVGNPYPRATYFDVRVYDENFQPIEAIVSPPNLKMPPDETTLVSVRVPFNGGSTRKVRVCAEGMFANANQSGVRTQVCGRYLATHIGPQ